MRPYLVELSPAAARQLRKLDRLSQRRLSLVGLSADLAYWTTGAPVESTHLTNRCKRTVYKAGGVFRIDAVEHDPKAIT